MDGYQQLIELSDIQRVASQCRDVWKAPTIPSLQSSANKELHNLERTWNQLPFDAFIRCIKRLPEQYAKKAGYRFLDVGASSGYYREVLIRAGFAFSYQGVDCSSAFAQAAEDRYPGIHYDVADICGLPYEDRSFDVVHSAGTIMHVYNWRKAIEELARVSSGYVILHRTPIEKGLVTTYWQKPAYGQMMFEIHFSEVDLMQAFHENRLYLEYVTDVFWDKRIERGHRSYLLRK